VETLLDEGHKIATVARTFKISRFALRRHVLHRAQQETFQKMVPAAEGPPQSDGLLGKLYEAERLVRSIEIEAKRRGDNRARLACADQLRKIVEVEGKLRGMIETGSRSLTVNVHNESRNEAAELREYLEVSGVPAELVDSVLTYVEGAGPKLPPVLEGEVVSG
jgi:hypothetical protein